MIGHPFYILDKVDSTNNYAMEQVSSGQVTHGTTWFAMEQTAGKGQRGKQWLSPPGENIMLTTALQPNQLPLSRQFMLSVTVALAAYDFFFQYAGDETCIKWSNDIYWRDRKAGGILIENVLRGNIWQYAIVGIGININQTQFPEHLPNPVSLRQITGKPWDSVALAQQLCKALQQRMQLLHPSNYNALLEEYKSHLFRIDQPALYKQNGQYFQGTIVDVLTDGKLCIRENHTVREFSFGEIAFVISR